MYLVRVIETIFESSAQGRGARLYALKNCFNHLADLNVLPKRDPINRVFFMV